MTVRLLDTLSGEQRELVPLEPGHVRIYSCGPTVYGPAHIGNFRSFLFAELLVRHLRWRGYRVTWVMNMTDIDDKIIRGAAAAGETIEDLADRWTERFLSDARTLRMTEPDVLPRATGHIDEIVALDRDAPRRGPCLPDRRRLDLLPDRVVAGVRARSPGSTRTSSGSASASRPTNTRKDDVRDFAIWKGPKPGEPFWDHERRRGPAGLAHRVLGDEHEAPRPELRHPHRRGRPDLSAPRGRDRPERGGDGPAVRPDLAALRPPPDGRREDGPVGRQHRPGRRGPRARRVGAGAALLPHRGPLPVRPELLRRVAGGGERGDRAPGRCAARAVDLPRGPARRSGAAGVSSRPPARRSARRSTTTSTCRPRWRRCSTWSAS